MRTPPPEERGGVPATSVISDQRRPEIETADAGEGVGASALSRESGVVAAKRKRRCPPPPEWIVCLARKVWSKEGLACAMAAATGWANIGCMIRYSAFAAMMTGNSLFAAVNLSVWNWEASLFYFSTIISYNIGAVAHTVIDLALGTRSTATAIAPVIFLLFLLADVCDLLIAYHHTWSQLGPVLGELEIEEKSQWAQNVPVFCVALGFGISNSLSLSFHSYTTMAVTGHMHKVCNSVAKNSFTLCNRMGGSPVDGQRSFDTEWRMSLLLILSFIFGSSIAGGIWKDYIPRFTKSFGSKGTQADQADQSELQLSEEGSSVLVVDFYFIMVGFVIAGLIMLHDRAYAQFLKKKLDHRERLDQHLRANSVMKANSFGSFASALSFRVRLASLTLEMERSQSGEAIWTSPRRSNGLSPFKGSVDTSKANGEEVGGSEAKQRTLFIDGLD